MCCYKESCYGLFECVRNLALEYACHSFSESVSYYAVDIHEPATILCLHYN